ncbi:hypothetical protein BDQ12DRAFT_593379 [Crucibulum laeve]|uniref:Uncharacterized protein n=1 Tax=Crucibulum laeve TaxID=68775 RepID=A0A5C3MJU4_9AGAR|nr:hypothetical protein BDQ12DRAFT_593379 [Crucibulum laeve]
MKRPIGSLAVRDDPYRFIDGNLKVAQASFDGLSGQTMQVALLGGEVGTSQEINDLRQQMRDQDQRQKEGIEEIQLILDDMLQNQVVASMRQQVQQEIIDQIDELVKEHIAECLKVHIPQDLQDDVEDSKRELREVRQALHNSESRRANANLRSNKPDATLNTIYMANGNISKHFPKDLQGLFSLDGEWYASCKFLMEDYELPHQSESRDLNLNRLMQFFGVRYQLVISNAFLFILHRF